MTRGIFPPPSGGYLQGKKVTRKDYCIESRCRNKRHSVDSAFTLFRCCLLPVSIGNSWSFILECLRRTFPRQPVTKTRQLPISNSDATRTSPIFVALIYQAIVACYLLIQLVSMEIRWLNCYSRLNSNVAGLSEIPIDCARRKPAIESSGISPAGGAVWCFSGARGGREEPCGGFSGFSHAGSDAQ